MATATTPSSAAQQPTGFAKRIESSYLLSKGTVISLIAVLILMGCMAAVWINVLQAQVPRNMPFGVVGNSPVVSAAQSQKVAGWPTSWANTTYTSESSAMDAINQGKIYAALIAGKHSDTLISSQAKSFFAYTEIVPLFAGTAKAIHRPLHIQIVHPLPAEKDPTGAVSGLLLLPAIVGGMVSAILIITLTGLQRQRWRGVMLVVCSAIGAVLNTVIAGPLIGEFPGNRFLPLLGALFLITLVSSIIGAAWYALLPRLAAMLVVVIAFIVLGQITAGDVALQPIHWQAIGDLFPNRWGSTIIQNILYFSSNGITTPIIVLLVYGLIAAAILGYLEWVRHGGAATPAPPPGVSAAQAAAVGKKKMTRVIVAVIVVSGIYQIMFSLCYGTANHNPVSRNMPVAVTGSSRLASAVEQTGSIKTTTYPSVAAAKTAMDQTKAWGALIPGKGLGKSTLLTVPSISDLAPWTLPVSFLAAAKSTHQRFTASSYTPTPLPHGDPFGLVLAILLTPLLLCGYVTSTLLKGATKTASGPLLLVILVGFSFVASLMVETIAGPWMGGIASGKFWILWPVMGLVMSVAALVGAVLERLLGPIGTLLTVLLLIWLGKPSGGGANGIYYLPSFWKDLGPFLPPRNAYLLMRNTVYFHGNAIGQPLGILLAYFAVFGVALAVLNWYRKPAPELPNNTPETEQGAAAAAVPAGVAP
jgi:hypothetical protein